MKTETYIAFRVDNWDDTSNSIVEYFAGVDDFEVAEATYRAACTRWPGTSHHLAAVCAYFYFLEIRRISQDQTTIASAHCIARVRGRGATNEACSQHNHGAARLVAHGRARFGSAATSPHYRHRANELCLLAV
jgi:hypothetical protein